MEINVLLIILKAILKGGWLINVYCVEVSRIRLMGFVCSFLFNIILMHSIKIIIKNILVSTFHIILSSGINQRYQQANITSHILN